MADYDEDEDFFEEDEPAEKVFAAFDRGEKFFTGPLPVIFKVVGLSANTGAVPPTMSGPQVGWLVTDAQAVTNTNRPPLARTG